MWRVCLCVCVCPCPCADLQPSPKSYLVFVPKYNIINNPEIFVSPGLILRYTNVCGWSYNNAWGREENAKLHFTLNKINGFLSTRNYIDHDGDFVSHAIGTDAAKYNRRIFILLGICDLA